ncbi:MAG TPA: hypothetical protein PKW90_07570, partial [Myxococcota bacterium]|nr:hypothetical protein [Myxococcota bacterium]
MSKRNEGDIEAVLGSLVGPPPPALHPHAAEAAREQLRRDVRALQERPEQLLLHLHAPPPPPLQSARLPARSTPLLIVAAAAILIGILIAGGLYAPVEPTPATPTNNLVHQPDVPPEAPTDPPPPPASQSPLPSTPTRPPPPQVPAPARRPQPAPHGPQ